jgi:CubicO group peptidase (beta-lactamase class C family)
MMEKERIVERLRENLENGIRQGIFPGGVTSLTVGSEPPMIVASGAVEAGEQAQPASERIVYDMASLTKVMVTLPLVLISVQKGKLSLTDPLITYVPELEAGQDTVRKRKITLLHLLTHTSGLPAWRPYFILGQGREAYLRLLADEKLMGVPGEQAVYSDLGFMLLGFVLERIWDEELSRLAQRLIFQPSGMTMTTYKPLAAGIAAQLIAPTEDGNGYELEMVRQQIVQASSTGHPSAAIWQECLDRFVWRKGIIRGTVHDGNCCYGLGGVSGHAGLFSTIGDVERYMLIWTSKEAEVRLDPVLRAHATRCYTGPFAPKRAMGWEASATVGTLEQTAAGCSGGDLLSAAAYGHTGFTGTSVWHDPLRSATLITLTNRVHPTVSNRMGEWRKSHHNSVFSLVTPSLREER